MADDTSLPIDPATSLPIYSPRTYHLRKLQRKDGKDCTNLRLEQLGLAPIGFMHHVSRIMEGKTESFRVRICRTCSGLPVLIELGSYADVESALLVNDVHEILQNRTRQLHLLIPTDVEYVQTLTVRKRGGQHEHALIHVIQERLLKSLSKRVPSGSVTGPDGKSGVSDDESEMPATSSSAMAENADLSESDTTQQIRDITQREAARTDSLTKASTEDTVKSVSGHGVNWFTSTSSTSSGAVTAMTGQRPSSSTIYLSADSGSTAGSYKDLEPDKSAFKGGADSLPSSSSTLYPLGFPTGSLPVADDSVDHMNKRQKLLQGPSITSSLPSMSSNGYLDKSFSSRTPSANADGRSSYAVNPSVLPPHQHPMYQPPGTQSSVSVQSAPAAALSSTRPSVEGQASIPKAFADRFSLNLVDLHKLLHFYLMEMDGSRSGLGGGEYNGNGRSSTSSSLQVGNDMSGTSTAGTNPIELVSALIEFLYSQASTANSRKWTERQAEWTQKMNNISKQCASWSRPYYLSLVLSAFPDHGVYLPAVMNSLMAALPPESITSADTNAAMSSALTAMQQVRTALARVGPRLQDSTGAIADLPSPGDLAPLESFIRIMHTSSAELNFSLRFWNVKTSNPTEALEFEIRLHGLFAQSVHKIRLLCPFVRVLKDLLQDIEAFGGSISSVLLRGDSNGSGFSARLGRLANSCQLFAAAALSYLRRTCVALGSLLVAASNACILSGCANNDLTGYATCATVFMQAISYVRDFVLDPVVLQESLQAYLELTLFSLSLTNATRRAEDGLSPEENPLSAPVRVLAYTLGTHLVQQSRKSFLAFPPDLRGVANIFQCEHSLRATISIFCTAVALSDTDYLRSVNVTLAGLVRVVFDKLVALLDWMQDTKCSISSANTMVSVFMFLHFCVQYRKGGGVQARLVGPVIACGYAFLGMQRGELARIFMQQFCQELEPETPASIGLVDLNMLFVGDGLTSPSSSNKYLPLVGSGTALPNTIYVSQILRAMKSVMWNTQRQAFGENSSLLPALHDFNDEVKATVGTGAEIMEGQSAASVFSAMAGGVGFGSRINRPNVVNLSPMDKRAVSHVHVSQGQASTTVKSIGLDARSFSSASYDSARSTLETPSDNSHMNILAAVAAHAANY